MQICLEELHDATLQRLELIWFEGVLAIYLTRVADPPEKLKLTLGGVTSHNLTRNFPWGESESLNKIDVIETEHGKRMKIEMQSGDYIEAKFDNINISSCE